MTEFERNRSQKLKIILFTLKILTILFMAVPVFQKIFPQQSSSFPTNDYTSTLLAELFTCAVIGLIMLLWKMLDKGNNRSRIYTVLELTIFFLLIMVSIYCSGGPTSAYKFLFLYLIISHAIEYGIRMGFAVSGISSVLVIATDVWGLVNDVPGNYLENDIAMIAMFISIAWTLGYYSSMEGHFIEMLKDHANRDGLTSCYNHRYFFEMFEKDFEDCRRDGRKLCLAMLDIDHFKEYNDTYGHQKGDAVLVRVVEEMKTHFSHTDEIFRYGGDEFSVILNGCSAEEASRLTDSFRLRLEKTLCVSEAENPYHVSGVYNLPYGADSVMFNQVFGKGYTHNGCRLIILTAEYGAVLRVVILRADMVKNRFSRFFRRSVRQAKLRKRVHIQPEIRDFRTRCQSILKKERKSEVKRGRGSHWPHYNADKPRNHRRSAAFQQRAIQIIQPRRIFRVIPAADRFFVVEDNADREFSVGIAFIPTVNPIRAA